ncbi:MAG: type I-C CRISPR-associated protein Cas8c/Csd1 [Eubacterium sp.]|jgi:CRISPR-associated protein Csd1|nr:type I-C CRISPR-associated protein Cas8c/Csd1 [Eubacterium sp.]
MRDLAQTYANVQNIVGITDEKGNALLPPNHMTKNTDICIVIDVEGNFRRANGEKSDKFSITIPCTENSASRAGACIAPHPLHEEIGYLSANKEKREEYLKLLSGWCELHPKVEAVYKYIFKNTLKEDLKRNGIKTDDKLFVRFSVEMPESNDLSFSELWKDNTVSETWIKYCGQNDEKEESLCYATGETDAIRVKHPKNINPSTSNAKLISCNDETNFTYRGRFDQANQASAVGEKASHQSHAMLKYLISTQGYKCDTQAIIAWSTDDGGKLASPLGDSVDIYCDETKTERDKVIDAGGILNFDYAKALKKAIVGKGGTNHLNSAKRRVAVMAVDAATTGRMAVTFYKNLPENEYVERIINWHETCCWCFWYKGQEYISAPSTDRIIAAVYGDPKGDGYVKIKKQARSRILSFILNGENFDGAWVSASVKRVSNPFSYDKTDGGWDKYSWERAMNVTCAIMRKYYIDKKEDFKLELEKTRSDRDYLYGRLLAIADKLEGHARFLQDQINDTDKRPTNSVRYMAAFATKPLKTWEIIYRQLSPYIQRLNGADWYQRQIDEVMSLFKNGEYESDKPLNGVYLLGYSLQRRALNNKNNQEEAKNA